MSYLFLECLLLKCPLHSSYLVCLILAFIFCSLFHFIACILSKFVPLLYLFIILSSFDSSYSQYFFVTLLCHDCTNAFYLSIAYMFAHAKPVDSYCNTTSHAMTTKIIANVIFIIPNKKYINFKIIKALDFHYLTYKSNCYVVYLVSFSLSLKVLIIKLQIALLRTVLV